MADLQHCSKCGEKCNPGAGMTVDGDRFHKDACPVVDPVARAKRQQNLTKAREARQHQARTLANGIVVEVRPGFDGFEGDSEGIVRGITAGATA